MSTAPSAGGTPARSSTRRRRRCASGTPRVWIPTSATRERSGFASISSCAIRESVRARPSLSRRTFSGAATRALRARTGSAVCGQAASFDSFPASLDRLKGVRSCGTLSARPDGVDTPVQLGPLPDVQIAWPGLPVETELDREPLQFTRQEDPAQALPVAARQEGFVHMAFDSRDQRLGAANDPKDAGVGGRWWREHAAGKPPRNRQLKPGAPVSAQLRARPDRRALAGEAPLDDDISSHKSRARIEQPAQDRRRAVEGEVRHHLEGFARKRKAEGVGNDDFDVRQTALELGRESQVDLYGDDASRTARQRCRQDAATCAEVEHEVVALNVRSANQLRCKLATAEKVLAAAASCSRSDGHGRLPCPYSNCSARKLRFSRAVCTGASRPNARRQSPRAPCSGFRPWGARRSEEHTS